MPRDAAPGLSPAPPRSRGRRAWEPALVLLAGALLFLVRFGPTVLDPGEVDWLLAREDPAAYVLTWDFFRDEPWRFPLGRVTTYLHPLGTTVPLADALPLLALPAKALAPALPDPFQYFGLWHLACALLQGWFGWRIARRFLAGGAARLLAAGLFLLAPVQLFREPHVALSSHWVLLAALDLYLAGHAAGGRRVAARWCALGAAVALIHPYLVAMTLPICVAQALRGGDGRRRGRAIVPAATLATVLLAWWVAGNLDGASPDRARDVGFGRYSLNLNALVNPRETGRLLPPLPIAPGQFEGFAYLGAGWLLLVAVAGATIVRDPARRARLRGHGALLAVLALCWLFALSHVVRVNETVLVQWWLPPPLERLAGVFRASGRFVWPVVYALMAGTLAVIGRRRERRAVAALLAAALALQAWDLSPFVASAARFADLRFATRLASPPWDAAAAGASGVTTVPPFRFTTAHRADYRDLCLLAARHGLPTTAGYAARISPAAAALADSLAAALAAGAADPGQLYVCARASFPATLAGLGAGGRGGRWDDVLVCADRAWPAGVAPRYPRAHRVDLAGFLAARRDRTLLLAVRDEATAALGEAGRAALRDLGVRERDLAYRASFAALVHGSRAAWQRADPGAPVTLALAPGDTVGGFRAARSIALASAGFACGDAASLALDGIEEGFGGRGINVLVLDEAQRLLEVGWFDTFAGATGVVVEVAGRP